MRSWTAIVAVSALVLAGCTSGGGGGGPVPSGDPTTGSIQGLVVDQAIVPVAGALVTIAGGANTTTDDVGAFSFSGLAPGMYVLDIGKLGFKGVRVSANVEAGIDEPDVVKVQLERLTTAAPYFEHYKLEGYYECTFALPFITDSCEFGYRTAWDAANETGNQPPAPRSIQNFRNTQYIDIPDDTYTIVQEGFWDMEKVPVFWIMIDETPIANDCDCSTSYANRIGEMPLLNRLERYTLDGTPNTNFTADETAHDSPKGEFPLGVTVASRGFIPFQQSPSMSNQDPNTWAAVGLQFQFTVMTTLFHNYVPDPAWTFETKDNYPLG